MTAFPVELDATFGCWLWRGKLDRSGDYGLVWRGKRPTAAHRVVYEQLVGAIGQGLSLEHECKNGLCVSPAHLRPVTAQQQEFYKRWSYRVRVGQCRVGHDLRLHSVVTPKSGRVCRLCSREWAGRIAG